MSDPRFYSRRELGMVAPRSISRNFNPAGGGVAGHWGGGAQRIETVDQAIARWLAWQRQHMNTHGWVDIGYTAGYWKGNVFAGRGYGVRPAAQRAGNADHYAFVWLGGSGEVPTEEDFATLAWMINDARDNGGAGRSTKPHSFWVATACPGPDIRAKLGEWDGKNVVVPDLRPEPEPAPEPTPAPTPTPTVTYITRGSTGARVREWQRLLISKGFGIPAGPTGNFLDQTVRATNQAYAAVGLSAADPNRPRVGERSFEALRSYNPQPWRGKRVVARQRVRFYMRPGWHPNNPTAGFLDAGWGFRGGIHEKRRVGGGYQYRVSNSNGHMRWITANENFIRLVDM